MFDRYGPNSLQVAAYIKALDEMSSEDFNSIDKLNLDVEQLITVFSKALSYKSDRLLETENASHDAMAAVINKGSNEQIAFVGLIASVLVLEDRLTRDEQVFLHLWVIDPKVPLRRLYADHRKEDFAIEAFCKHLSRLADESVYVKSRPDARGQIGEALPDFILHRGGSEFTIEHTFINSYENQLFYEHLFSKYIKPLDIEETIKQQFPNKLVDIAIPIDAFKRDSQARKFNFDRFLRNLIDAVGRTKETDNIGPSVKFEFSETPFPVFISKCKGFGVTFLAQIVPTDRERVKGHLVKEMGRALHRKRKKLKAAKARGERTVLLLDSDDYALLNWEILSKAFSKAARGGTPLFDGIDDIYIQHRGGTCWIFPVKLKDRLYPDLPEFDQYWKKQAALLGVHFDS